MEATHLRVEDVPDGQTRVARTGSDRVFLVSRGANGIRAFQGTCTHEGTEFDELYVEGRIVTCPAHYSQFDGGTGEVLEPPAERSLEEFTVELQDGEIYIGSAMGESHK